ncbi:MAG: hypothetical protein GY855_09950, partial [candidate division Zixibacteria bacterium]|nr:hypothetical protein [candidate division Zixibacteria bacterium]
RIAVLRGEKTSARELAQDGIGIVLEESLFQAITDMINPVINDVLSQDDFIDMAVDVVAGIPLQIGLIEPVKTVLEMTINDIIMLEDREVKVHNLEILDPEMDDSVRFLAEMSFKGFELDAAVGIFLFGNEAQTVNVKMRLNEEVRALLDIRLDTIDSNKIGIKLVNLDIDINDIEITLPDMPVFNKNPIKIENGLAMLLNLAFSRLLDDLIGFSILLPDSPMNLGMMNDLLDGMSISL